MSSEVSLIVSPFYLPRRCSNRFVCADESVQEEVRAQFGHACLPTILSRRIPTTSSRFDGRRPRSRRVVRTYRLLESASARRAG